MGKNKKRKFESVHSSYIQHGNHIQNKHKPNSKSNHDERLAKPTIPFEPHDRILLVGEGDFSFARSIVEYHGCADVLATCLDSEAELHAKYPQARANIDYIRDQDQRVLAGIDARKLQHKAIRKASPWNRIIFNFPHVGGKSTDVNRQVRYNQDLLVTFLRAALPLLQPSPAGTTADTGDTGGTILITLFEGEPYTLWNVRDLARHVGLSVVRSFRFGAEAYPGYRHARTLGRIVGRGGTEGGEVDGEEGGEEQAGERGWRGEERKARTFEFMKGEGAGAGQRARESAARKRKGKGSDEEEDDDD